MAKADRTIRIDWQAAMKAKRLATDMSEQAGRTVTQGEAIRKALDLALEGTTNGERGLRREREDRSSG
jgi:hypothetical protein